MAFQTSQYIWCTTCRAEVRSPAQANIYITVNIPHPSTNLGAVVQQYFLQRTRVDKRCCFRYGKSTRLLPSDKMHSFEPWWAYFFLYRCHGHEHGGRCTVGEDKEGLTQTVLLGEPQFLIVLLRRFTRTERGLVKNNQTINLGEEIVLNGNEYVPFCGTAHLGRNLNEGMKVELDFADKT